jgi:2-polyprenyl-3-methyl-5-hydroxy-6-metoxy-1,4-benzoquinol methylase
MTSILTAPNDLKDRDGSQTQSSTGINAIPRPLCPLCNCEGKLLYMGLADWLYGVPETWGTRRCSLCGVAWLDPQPVANDIQRLYSHYCTHDASRPMTWIGRLQHAMSDCALARLGYPVDSPKGILPRLLSHLPSAERAAVLNVLALPVSGAGSLLDVGCGNGQFIARMRSFGWKVYGIDPDPAAVSYGQRQGLDIKSGTISDLPDTDCYDVITLSHVVEHVADPVDLLRECGKRLRPGVGRLIITTPNINSLGHALFRKYWRGLEVPRHFILFSPAGLRDCVERAGLSTESMSTETRLAQMIYRQSAYAKAGDRGLGERTNFKMSTKVAARLFRMIEDSIVRLKKDAGEEIFCVCTKPVENDRDSEKHSRNHC